MSGDPGRSSYDRWVKMEGKLYPGEERSPLELCFEFLPDRLILKLIRGKKKPDFPDDTYDFTIDDELKYEPFYEDFGPLNLAHLYLYCKKLEDLLSLWFLAGKKIVHYTSSNPRYTLNSAYLMGSYGILYHDMTVDHVMNLFGNEQWFIQFRDASVGEPQYTISLRDTLNAVARAKEWNFFIPCDFDVETYQKYETVENGDMNWIVPDKILAFAGPVSEKYRVKNKSRHPHNNSRKPEEYLKYFRAHNVKTVVRLNSSCYNAAVFTNAGIEHYDLCFEDGGVPTDDLVLRFLRICAATNGAVAIHCKAGLGRTGTMIACFLMKWYQFTAREAIAWVRICRPASIIGHQQNWLVKKQEEMWHAGRFTARPHHTSGLYSLYTGSNSFNYSTNTSHEREWRFDPHTGKPTNAKTPSNRIKINSKAIKKRILDASEVRKFGERRSTDPIASRDTPPSSQEDRMLGANLPRQVNVPVVEQMPYYHTPDNTVADSDHPDEQVNMPLPEDLETDNNVNVQINGNLGTKIETSEVNNHHEFSAEIAKGVSEIKRENRNENVMLKSVFVAQKGILSRTRNTNVKMAVQDTNEQVERQDDEVKSTLRHLSPDQLVGIKMEELEVNDHDAHSNFTSPDVFMTTMKSFEKRMNFESDDTADVKMEKQEDNGNVADYNIENKGREVGLSLEDQENDNGNASQVKFLQGNALQQLITEKQPSKAPTRTRMANTTPGKKPVGLMPNSMAVNRKAATIGKIGNGKRVSTRKATGQVTVGKNKEEDNYLVANPATASSEIPLVPPRRSQRLLEPRKTVVHR